MVSMASAAAQANEMEKKRKQTLQRAKANHLSRQLQMRLQYARLKVEHGWQRQNLNEVENLYFHHSQQRGPKSYTSSSTLTSSQMDQMSVVTTSTISASTFQPLLQSQSRSLNSNTLPENPSQENSWTVEKLTHEPVTAVMSQLPASSESLRTSSTPTISLEAQVSQPPHNLISYVQTPAKDSQILLSVQNMESGTSTTAPSHTSSNHHPATASTPMSERAQSSISPLSQPTQHTTTLAFTDGNITCRPTAYTHTPIALSNGKKSSMPHINKPSSTTKDVFGMNTSSLTYDSFWSGLQSKSYPSLKSGGASVAAVGSAVNSTSSVTSSDLPHNQITASSAISSSSASVPSAVSALNTTSTSSQTSTSTPSPSLPSIPLQSQPLSPLPSPTSPTVPTAGPVSILLPPSVPVPTPLSLSPSSTTHSVSPQLPMTTPNRYDHLIPWTFAATQPTPGAPVLQHHLIPASFLSNPAAFPFLANLSASYSQMYTVQGHPSIGGGPVSDSTTGQVAPGVSVPVSNVPVSSSAPPVVSAFVGQQKS